MIAFTAIVMARAVPVAINSWGKAEELEWVLADTKARVVFCDTERHLALQAALKQLNATAILVRAQSDVASAEHTLLWPDLLVAGHAQPALDLAPPDSEEQAIMLYTSGTTGHPHGVMTRHRQICQALADFDCTGAAMGEVNGDILMAALARGCDFSTLLAVPLFHVSGCHALFLRCLRGGQRIVMMYKWDAREAVRLIAEQQINVISVAPFMVMQLLEEPSFATIDRSTVISIGSGGSALPLMLPDLIEQLCPEQLPGCGYGATETNAAAVSMNGHLFRYRSEAAGLISPIIDVELRTEEGQSVATGGIGEIWVYGPTVSDGYWQQPEHTASSFRDGWFRSGDLGQFDDEGYLHIVGRIKEQIIRAGENIAPLAIEDHLREHPAVNDVAVFGLPHDKLGEEVAVRIVTTAGSTCETQELRNWLSERIAHFKVPAHWQIGSEPLPRNASGKVLKKQLMEATLKTITKT